LIPELARHQRTEERLGHRNGYRPRTPDHPASFPRSSHRWRQHCDEMQAENATRLTRLENAMLMDLAEGNF